MKIFWFATFLLLAQSQAFAIPYKCHASFWIPVGDDRVEWHDIGDFKIDTVKDDIGMIAYEADKYAVACRGVDLGCDNTGHGLTCIFMGFREGIKDDLAALQQQSCQTLHALSWEPGYGGSTGENAGHFHMGIAWQGKGYNLTCHSYSESN